MLLSAKKMKVSGPMVVTTCGHFGFRSLLISRFRRNYSPDF